MPENEEPTNWPAAIADGIQTIGRGITPESIKALNRLIGATADTGVAKLKQIAARIDAQTRSYVSIEEAIAKAVVAEVGADQGLAKRAASALVHKAYRQQANREAVAKATVEELAALRAPEAQPDRATGELDEDWLNVFERYAEDASTERMQKLWGRVLAGEVRKPGRYSLRTLRFLSEFSQAEAMKFSEFCSSAFGDRAPKHLVNTNDNIRDLIYLESSGLILTGGGTGLTVTCTFNTSGLYFWIEGDVCIVFKGTPGSKIVTNIISLTPLGQELLMLLPERDVQATARKVANAVRVPEIAGAYLAEIRSGLIMTENMEIIWQTNPGNIEVR